jgi:hypothetical protein
MLVFPWLLALLPAQEPAALLVDLPGLSITRQEYLEHLYRSIGGARLEELLLDKILAQKVQTLDWSRVGATTRAALEEPERRVRQTLEQQIAADHGGDGARWRQTLFRSNVTEAEAIEALRVATLREDRLAALVQSRREPGAKALRRLFDAHYGVDGQRVALRHVLVSFHRIRYEIEGHRRGVTATQAEIDRIATERAQKLQQDLAAGLTFEELQRRSDDPRGLIADYDYQQFGVEFAEAVRAMQPGESRLVRSSHGWHLVRLESRKTTKFEDVQPELQQLLREEPPTLGERQRLIDELLAAGGARPLRRGG